MGLPGSGKSTLAAALALKLSARWFNADEVRAQYNDWDFSLAGRIRQSNRMRSLCDLCSNIYTIADFVCPLPEMRDNFSADWTIWVDTITSGRFEDTNKAFIPPTVYDFRVTEQDADKWADIISLHILESSNE
jgi:hypothetical protein